MSLCFLAQFSADYKCEYRADGLPDRAHLIPAERIRQAGLKGAAWDRRVYVMACRKHHKEFDSGTIKLQKSEYPAALHSFAKQYGFFYAGLREGWLKEHDKEAA